MSQKRFDSEEGCDQLSFRQHLSSELVSALLFPFLLLLVAHSLASQYLWVDYLQHLCFCESRRPKVWSQEPTPATLHASSPLFARDNKHKKTNVSSCGYTWLISCLTHTPWEWNRQRKLDFRPKQFRRWIKTYMTSNVSWTKVTK